MYYIQLEKDHLEKFTKEEGKEAGRLSPSNLSPKGKIIITSYLFLTFNFI